MTNPDCGIPKFPAPKPKDCKSATNKPHADLGWVFEGGLKVSALICHPGMIGWKIGLFWPITLLETDMSAEN